MEKLNIINESQLGGSPSSPDRMKMYKDIFWEEPWKEWFVCQSCWKILPKCFWWRCECWSWSNFEPFYNNKGLKEEFQSLSKKPGYSELIAEILGEKIWFIWWWSTDIDSLNEDKLKLDYEQLTDLILILMDMFPDFDTDSFYYLAEIWVRKDYRDKDIAGSLYREIINNLKENQEKYVLARTTRKSNKPYKRFLKEWFREVFSYDDQQDRVILVLKL